MILRSIGTSVHISDWMSHTAIPRAIVFVLMLMTSLPVCAEVPSRVPAHATYQGTEFWLCFTRNFKDASPKASKSDASNLQLELFIAAEAESKVRIEIEGLDFTMTRTVAAGAVERVVIDKSAELKELEVIKRLAVHVVADNPISVYGLSSRFQTTDAFLGLPVSALGTDYMVMGYKYSETLLSQFAIVATDDETVVSITPTANTSTGHIAHVPYDIRMRKGDVIQVSSVNSATLPTDLTGSRITSNKPIAVFSGHQCAYVPEGIPGCNFLVEQLPPISSWGKTFIVGEFYSRAKYTVRVLAKEANTKVYLNSQLVATLSAGQIYENSDCAGNSTVSSSQPVLVAQFSHGYHSGDETGDPMMLLVTPTEFYLNSYQFATPKTGEWNHYVNVVVPTSSIGSVLIDGKKPGTAIEFIQVNSTPYSVAQIKVTYGYHTISADQPLGVSSYGFGYGSQVYDAYGTSGGQWFTTIGTKTK